MFFAILLVQAVLFLWWAYEAFRALFDLRSRAEAETGQMFPGPVTFLKTAGHWLRDPATRPHRLRLLILTVILMSLSLASAMTVQTTA